VRVRRHSAALVLVALLGCRSAAAGPEGGGLRVLFVGNSLTSANDLPRMLEEVAASGGDTIRASAVVAPGTALIDHANGATNALAVIRRGGWDVVVLQQGPTWPGVCLDTLVLATRIFDRAIRGAGARPALYMVWPAASALDYFDGVRQSYETAAGAVDGVLLPAGVAWREAWRAYPAMPLYGSDDFHPSRVGTYLAALVMYERLTGRDARALPARPVLGGRPLDLPDEAVRLLQQAAHAANAKYETRSTKASESRTAAERSAQDDRRWCCSLLSAPCSLLTPTS